MLIVEDGTGKPDAESYASVADANAYHEKRRTAAAWTALSDPAKEIALREATDYMVAVYRGYYQGWRSLDTQRLDWPRVNVIDENRVTLDSDFVPEEVKACCAELALIANSRALMPTTGKRSKKRVKVGPLEVEYDGEGPQADVFIQAVSRMRHFLAAPASGFGARLVRT